MREACNQIRSENEAASRAHSRVPSIERLLTPKPFTATDRVSLRADSDNDSRKVGSAVRGQGSHGLRVRGLKAPPSIT